MHPVILSLLRQFVTEHSLDSLPEDQQFERFVNFSIVANRCPIRIDPEDITTGQPEVGIDGVAIIVGEGLILTEDEARDIFSKRSRDIPVAYIFTQAKRSESFERNAILNLGNAVRDVVSGVELPQDSKLREASAVHKVVIENITKVTNGQPNCHLFYATSGSLKEDQVLTSTTAQVKDDLEETKFFREISVNLLGFSELRTEWMATMVPSEAQFDVVREIPIPAIRGVEEALLLVVNAKEFVEKVLADTNGILRPNIFDQNVRHFLGFDNDVNNRISETLRDPEKRGRFAILNNGITIVASSVHRSGGTVAIRDFQVVNGCQTSHVLFHFKLNFFGLYRLSD